MHERFLIVNYGGGGDETSCFCPPTVQLGEIVMQPAYVILHESASHAATRQVYVPDV